MSLLVRLLPSGRKAGNKTRQVIKRRQGRWLRGREGGRKTGSKETDRVVEKDKEGGRDNIRR